MQRRRILTTLSVSAVVAALLSPVGPQGTAQGAAPAPPTSAQGIAGTTRVVSSSATTTIAAGAPGSVGRPASHELSPVQVSEGDVNARTAAPRRTTLGVNRTVRPDGTGAASRRSAAPAAATKTGSTGIVRTGPELLRSLPGLNHFDSRTADGGNQFSGEPPDQALCAGNGLVVESDNTADRVRDPTGAAHGVASLNRFYGFASAFVRPDGPFGPNLFDPTCVFDPQTGTFFHVVDDLEVDPATGDLTGRSFLDLAVTKHPLGAWKVYRLDVTDDGSAGTPVHAGCPCLGDYPHVGVDAHGFYITTNEFSLFGPEFDSAQVYAFSKAELASAADQVHVTQFDTSGADRGNGGFTVWPAQSPSAADFDRRAGGTAYFLSSNAVFDADGVSGAIVSWSMTGTSTLGQQHPTARLRDSRVKVDTYSVPPPVVQRDGPAPLLECLNDPACRPALADPGPPEVLQSLDSNDSRMQQVVLAGGRLYGALDTGVQVAGKTQAGVAWFVLDPAPQRSRLRAGGQLGVAGNDIIYPAVGVTTKGRGVIAMTLAGPSYYPSAAYAPIDARGVGQVRVAAAGLGPQDGFAGYAAYNAPDPVRPRWGDYGAASAMGDEVWIASEYIGQRCTLRQYEADPFGTCGNTRTALANWGTRISQIRP